MRFIDENMKLKDDILELELELERNCKPVRTLSDKQNTDEGAEHQGNRIIT